MTRTIKIPAKLTRAATIEITGEGETRAQRMSVSSDEPYLRYDLMTGEEYFEVLDHAALDETRLRAGLPILFNHDRDKHLARATAFVNDGSRVTLDMASFKWSGSEFAKEKRADIESGALPDTSVGYEITGNGKQIGEREGKPVIAFPWRIFEASAVTIPADITVGVARSRTAEEGQEFFQIGVDAVQNEPQSASTMTTETENTPQETPATPAPENTPAPETVPTVDVAAERASAVAEFKARAKKITDWAEALAPKFRDAARAVARKHIEGDADFDSFRTEALNAMEKAAPIAGGDAPQTGSTLSRSQFSALSPMEQRAHIASGGKLTD